MATGLELTYEILTKTRNEAAVGVLLPALDSEESEVRLRAVRAILRRDSEEGARAILYRYASLPGDVNRDLLGYETLLNRVARQMLRQEELQSLTLDAIARIPLVSLTLDVVKLAESAEDFGRRREAAETALRLAWRQGLEARDDPNRGHDRGPIISFLMEVLRNQTREMSPTLVDTLLSIVRWDDAALKSVVAETAHPGEEVVLERLTRSRQHGVVHLLAGWIRRPKIPALVQPIIKTRTDAAYLEALLQAVGTDPSATTLKNLRSLGPIACLRSESLNVAEIPERLRPSLLHAYLGHQSDQLRTAAFTMEMLRHWCSDGVEDSAAKILTSLNEVDADLVMRAALSISRGDEEAKYDPSIRTVSDLLNLIRDPRLEIANGARHALRALHVDALVERIEELAPATSRRLGGMIRNIDRESRMRIEELMRHSIGRYRIRGILAAVALDFVDELEDSWRRVFQGPASDHQEARMAAVNALRQGKSERTLSLLQSISQTNKGIIADAANAALAERLSRVEVTA